MPTIKCLICGREKHYSPSFIKKGGGKFCSRKCYYESSKGRIPWNRDLHGWQTAEHKENFKKALIKRNKEYPTSSTQARINGSKAKVNSGKTHYRWQNGKTSINKKIRNSIKYEVWRKQVFERDNYICQKCHKHVDYLQAHHIKPFFKYPELHFNVSNGITLCLFCHALLHPQHNGKILKTT